MSARSLGVLARCAGALMALATVGSCADDGVSWHVICPIPPEVEDSSCLFDPAGDVCSLQGVLNVGITDVYKQVLRVESGLKAREREVPPLGETNGIQARSATIDIRLPSGERIGFAGLPNPFRVVATGYIAPESPGLVALDMITPGHATQLGQLSVAQIVVHVKIEGKTSGEETVNTGEYVWPVRIVNGLPGGVCAEMDHCPSLRGQDGFAFACANQPE